MVLTAHQPTYLSWCGLFAKIAMADTFVLFDDVQYCPKDYQNRNKIWTSHGPSWLTVPVLHSRDIKIKDVEINNDLPWMRKHWRSIEQSYHKAAHWHEYEKFFHGLYNNGTWIHLADFNGYILTQLLKKLDIHVNYLKASDYTFHGTKSELILDMCVKLGADTYIFGALGKDYADVPAFERAGIQVIFQEYRHPLYSQFGGAFMSNLSIIDLLFHHGPAALDILMTGNWTAHVTPDLGSI